MPDFARRGNRREEIEAEAIVVLSATSWARWELCGGEKFADFEKAGGEIAGAGGQPCADQCEGEKEGVFDFGGWKHVGTVMFCGENFDEFLTGVRAGADFADRGEVGADPEFFFCFPRGGGGISLAGFEVSRGARIPFAGLAVFPGGTFLQKEFTLAVEDQNVHRAVEQGAVVDLLAGAGVDDFVLLIDDIECFSVLLGGSRRGGVESAGQGDPLRDGKIFGPAGGGKIVPGAPSGPNGGVGFEQGAKLLAALAKTALDELVKKKGTNRGGGVRFPPLEGDEGRIDAGLGKENGGRKQTFAAYGPESLGAHGEGAVVGLVGERGEALGEFVLHGKGGADHGRAGAEPGAQDRRGGAVGQVAGEGEGAVEEERTPVEVDRVGRHDFHAVGWKCFAQPSGEAGVLLDDQQAIAALKERGGEGTEAGADFDRERDVVGKSRGRDGAGQILVVEKILPEAFGRSKLEFVQGEAKVSEAQEEEG